MTHRLRRIAYLEAAAILIRAVSAVDLDPELSEDDEATVRDYIREKIAAELKKKGEP